MKDPALSGVHFLNHEFDFAQEDTRYEDAEIVEDFDISGLLVHHVDAPALRYHARVLPGA